MHIASPDPSKKGGVNDGLEAIFYGFVVSLGVFRRGKVTFGSVYLKNRRPSAAGRKNRCFS